MEARPTAYNRFLPLGQAYAETLLKDESPLYNSYSLYRALALTVTWGTAYRGPSP